MTFSISGGPVDGGARIAQVTAAVFLHSLSFSSMATRWGCSRNLPQVAWPGPQVVPLAWSSAEEEAAAGRQRKPDEAGLSWGGLAFAQRGTTCVAEEAGERVAGWREATCVEEGSVGGGLAQEVGGGILALGGRSGDRRSSGLGLDTARRGGLSPGK